MDQATATTAAVDVDRQAVPARAYVAKVRADQGVGPTWSELCAHLGWTKRYGTPRVEGMIRRGYLTATEESQSLDLGPTDPEATEGLTRNGVAQ